MKIDQQTLRAAYIQLRAAQHPLRVKLMEYIDSHKEINVNAIYKALGLEQSVTSQHLRILREAGLVKARRDGKKIFYSVNYGNIDRTVDLARELGSIK